MGENKRTDENDYFEIECKVEKNMISNLLLQ